MPLSLAECKHRMPHGALQRVARAEGVANSYVTAVMNRTAAPKSPEARERVRRIQIALAQQIGEDVDDVFPPEQEPGAQTNEEAAPLAARAS